MHQVAEFTKFCPVPHNIASQDQALEKLEDIPTKTVILNVYNDGLHFVPKIVFFFWAYAFFWLPILFFLCLLQIVLFNATL